MFTHKTSVFWVFCGVLCHNISPFVTPAQQKKTQKINPFRKDKEADEAFGFQTQTKSIPYKPTSECLLRKQLGGLDSWIPLWKGLLLRGIHRIPNRARAPRPQNEPLVDEPRNKEKKTVGPYFPLSHPAWFKTGWFAIIPIKLGSIILYIP